MVVWNIKSNRIVGLAMSMDNLPSLHDIFRPLDEDHRAHQATYILQFMWRDVTSDFDVIGPYFTAATPIETKFLLSCLFEAMFVFETYGFEVVALIRDGASCNLSLLKQPCGTTGKYGSLAGDGDVKDNPVWFINPYSGEKTYLFICPSHQVHDTDTFMQYFKYTCLCCDVKIYMHVHTILIMHSNTAEEHDSSFVQLSSWRNQKLLQRWNQLWLANHHRLVGERPVKNK